ncbi:hypothetical protein [Acidianus sp. HS-5]|uniref:hypothetical protein n=1 Tax=Acidianus sp. HS-5 TaxID=2886040 RepID=UPI001F33724A|nr:hypothetical protein [Acidianus sp. HS-5]BDC17918.1 hypothetical protein HS5_08080 [Acidianus sp. HS-5]
MILTADPATFYSLPPLPERVLPLIRKNKYPPYGLRKIEAITNARIVPPSKIGKTNVLGIYVNDPFALTPQSSVIREAFGEEPGFYYSFKRFASKIRELKTRFNFKVIAGGPGAWELLERKEKWVDTIVVGEAENVIFDAIKREGVIWGTPAEKFYPIKSPSATAEVEIMRGNRKVPREVILKEMEVQSVQGKVNLISPDLFSYGTEEEILELLRISTRFGKVFFNQISLRSISKVDVSKVSKTLGLSESNYRTPVLSKEPGVCNLDVEDEAIKELNKNFIYPMIFSPSDALSSFEGLKAIIIPLPGKDYPKALYEAWTISRSLIRNKLIVSLVDRTLLKNKETKGEFLRKLNFKNPLHLITIILK